MLLILAGVAIVTLTGENGILERGRLAKEETEQAKITEDERLEDYEEQIDTLGRAGSKSSNYSTEEQVIGKWVDGKNLYQKTVSISINEGATSIEHKIENLDEIVNIFGITDKSSTNHNARRPIPFNYYANSEWNCGVNVDDSNIGVEAGKQFAANHLKGYITIQYTKTTD